MQLLLVSVRWRLTRFPGFGGMNGERDGSKDISVGEQMVVVMAFL